MTKAKIKMLEKVFAAEIDGRLPMQSNSKLMTELEAEGMVERSTRTFPPDRFGPIQVTGWILTHQGRFTYCQWASTQPLPDMPTI